MSRGRRVERARSRWVAVVGAAALVVGAAVATLAGCSATPAVDASGRGRVLSSDGTVLAESLGVERAYPLGELTSTVVGSLVTQGAPAGVEQTCDDELRAGEDVRLTLDLDAQRAAADALADQVGSAVVLDADTGTLLALVSTPAYDPAAARADDEALVNRAVTPYVPGSTFKTVTLAAALEQGVTSLEERIPGPDAIDFGDWILRNYDWLPFDGTLAEAYASSVNTVFAQLSLRVGTDAIGTLAERLGFGSSPTDDLAVEPSAFVIAQDADPYVRAWAGVGQTTDVGDGVVQGPFMTVVQGAVIAADVARGGRAVRPYLLASDEGDDDTPGVGAGAATGDADAPEADAPAGGAGDDAQVISQEVAAQLDACMRLVVSQGTGTGAAVEGVEVAGKTGTTVANERTGPGAGWFVGYARARGRTYAAAVRVEGVEGSDAAEVFGALVRSLFAR